ncbi:type II toxin-antitoxin system RelE/ParE family toxin [Salmonella enterica]|uniref:type II toxin-antitoxin system RelE/ParE family toxin n=1 Tax=Salmonella enterica TaxID=28901 RepID=UPI000A18EB94|nr:type II toxin-antitoxin system RelE/ParE family toxin [Salmonella enterica]ECU4745586.1 type II toxin-antitoxin system RelE/ParE family toxin [Salmonella enterica subsp. enterica serovar Berta]EEJ6627266.1 type II toxin-antitoxin system RelE/ParE family toxin [Salmonella enterica subsp. enterica serovar Sandiego]EJG2877177.1 type II toxin-antitoxin system RelE/ParE family toxin [Salmonella enterica subsp. enterica serovar Norwich]AXR36591.1 type II toxin-antitoxin system RelE/ParE family tox
MSVKFTKKAREHIRAIKLYSLCQWGVSVTEAYADSLRVTMTDILDRSPSPGRDRSEDLHVCVRSFSVEIHIIYYREVPAGIEVLAVLH